MVQSSANQEKQIKKALFKSIQKGIFPNRILQNHSELLDQTCGKDRSTLLHVAIKYDHWEIVENLLNMGANSCIPDKNGMTADELLHMELRRKQSVFRDGRRFEYNM